MEHTRSRSKCRIDRESKSVATDQGLRSVRIGDRRTTSKIGEEDRGVQIEDQGTRSKIEEYRSTIEERRSRIEESKKRRSRMEECRLRIEES